MNGSRARRGPRAMLEHASVAELAAAKAEGAREMREQCRFIALELGGCGGSCGMDGQAAKAIAALPIPGETR